MSDKILKFNTYYENDLNDLYYIVRSENPNVVLFCREPFKKEEIESTMDVDQISHLLLLGSLKEAVF
ncbi:hypothetical protein rv5_gp131 [Escherichia phage V5]|jgi:hypothetical protein|uniref:Uncharacterized protein n=4 Tax=Vequintavirus TaxID=1914852 RepID=B3RGS0_9CAUD|nr:hypothetical protein [Escherichia coli]YP_002003633.1 hypothetical protein rv5_gp131 [Escherichia phage V5]YP_009031036.1 hypothetical protein FG37_gp159 [Escherichia phage FFH2]AKE45695.1 hypothetical protein ECTP5_00828 [Escherichia coli O157 typing phage 5]EKP4068398.1 hypothetical protein [Escherichia coli O157]QHR73072.1 hypothetical protein nimi_46 [Escherichia phage nimi]WIL78457.1 hypothetical protein NWUPM10C2_126' [Escherichia phage vB_EcoM_10C2_SA_NWU]WIL79211.1 hypothetical pr